MPATVELNIAQIDAITTRWKMSTNSPVTRTSGGYEAVLTSTTGLDIGGLYQLNVFSVHDLESGRGERFPTEPDLLVFTIRGENSPMLSPADVVALVTSVSDERREFFDQAVGDEDGSTEYRVKILVAGLHLTTILSYPGLQVRPLSIKRGPTWDGEVLSEILATSGWGVIADLDAWASGRLRSRPMALMNIDRIRADSGEEAHRTAMRLGEAVLDVLALRRDARGEIVGSAVQEDGNTVEALIAPHGPTYRGNLLGGFISGEDPHDFVKEVEAVLASPRLALLLSLYAEAEAEDDLDFAYFRFWGLLELISMTHVSDGIAISDFADKPVDEYGKSVNTGQRQSRANVYELLKQSFMAGSIGEKRPSVRGSGTLWDATGVWYGRRNATAHYGGLRAGDSEQRNRPWFASALVAYELAEYNGGQNRFHDHYFEWLRSSTKIILDREILGKPMHP